MAGALGKGEGGEGEQRGIGRGLERDPGKQRGGKRRQAGGWVC